MNFLKRFFLSDRVILFAILLNAILIFVMAFPYNDHFLPYRIAEFCFTLFFLIEIIVKCRHYGFNTYLQDNFNKLDFAIIILSIPMLISPFIVLPQVGPLLIFRLLRLVRLIRLLTFIPNIGQLITGLRRAFKASIFILMALVLYNFMLAIITCEFFRFLAPKHFGDPFISIFTIFQMFTTEGWNEIANEIAANSEGWTAGLVRLYFMFVVLSGGIFGISIANAVFVDEMTLDNNVVLEEKIDTLNQKIERLEALLLEQRKDQ